MLRETAPEGLRQAMIAGQWAADRLQRPEWTARVIGVVSHAIYFEDDAGEILWLSPPGSVLHRRGILVPLDAVDLHQGDVFRCDGGTLCCGEHLLVGCDGMPVWNAPPVERSRGTLKDSAEALARGLDVLRRNQSPLGTARFALPGTTTAQHQAEVQEEEGGDWLDGSAAPILGVERALRARDGRELLDSGRALVGLGGGLTPSGDDFLGGLLFGLRAQRDAGHDLAWVDWGAVQVWAGQTASRTNRISHILLRDLAAGHGPAPLHDLARATLAGGSCESIARRAEEVAAIGHTSGRDLLAGFSAAILTVAASDDGSYP
jgi:hypothetical protein